MKKILFILLFSLLFSFSAQAQEFVDKGFFPADRVVDIRACSVYRHDRNAFGYCANVMMICQHKVLKNPIGELFGILTDWPVLNEKTGEYDWVERIAKSSVDDKTSRAWCVKVGVIKDSPTLDDDIKSGKEIL